MKKYLHNNGLAVYSHKNNNLFLMLGWIFILTLLFCLRATANVYSHNSCVNFDSPGVKISLNIIDAKDVVVTGRVTTEKGGQPLHGVSVKLKGSSLGTSTDAEGKYSIRIPDNGVLVFSFIGYVAQEVVVNSKTIIDIKMVESARLLGEVAVTALGIQKSSKSITYTMQKIAGDKLNAVPQTNFMNSLSGKVAGVDISSSASGIGGSVKVLIRGNKSVLGSNRPLYVIDGIPMTSNPSDSNSGTFSSRDGGDGISNLNPDDIESMSILKGASAAALYGSAAANGVILITSKKGKIGVTKVNFSSSYTMDKVAYTPELQNSYGQTSSGSTYSWGNAITNATDNVSGFFKTGSTLVNAISFSSGTEKAQSYFSYANTTGNGVLQNNTLSRHNLNFHTTARYFNNKLSIDINGNFITQALNNSPTSGFIMSNVLGLYLFPRGLDFNQYKNPAVFDPVRKLMTQNWFIKDKDIVNPYWLTDYIKYKNARNRAILKLAAKYDITNSLSFQVRGNVDKTYDVNTSKMYVGTHEAAAGPNGRYSINYPNGTLSYGDAMLNFTKSFGKIQVNGALGASITDSYSDGIYTSSMALYIPNVFTVVNMDPTSPNTSTYSSPGHSQLQAAFGDVNLSYNDWLFLDITGRNDWSSSLSYTSNGSYFYPSAGLSAILNNIFKMPEAISLAKLRGSYAVVGNGVPMYVTNPLNHLSRGGGIQFNTTAPFGDLNPEKTKSLEFGTELGFFNGQFSADFTYYKTNSTNQFFSILVPPGTGYSRRFINAGNIQNSGVELTLGYTSLPKSSLKWSTLINFSTNKNIVKSLAKDVDQFVLAQDNNMYYSILKPGGSFGDIYGMILRRNSADGKIIIGSTGAPLVQTGVPSLLGNSNPKFQLGWDNSFIFKNFTFSFLLDGKFGGKVLSMTQMMLDGYGVSKASGNARANGGVTVNGMLADGTPVTKVDAYKWYFNNWSSRVNGEYMYYATVIRAREAAISYSLPATILKNRFIKNIQLSLIGRNLAYLYKPAPFDPEITFSTGNAVSGVDVMSLPATRSFGLNLNVTF